MAKPETRGDSGGDELETAGALTELMREIDDGFFCRSEREVADAYWADYLGPELERLFTPDVAFHSHFEGPSGLSLYNGYEGLRTWASDVAETFTRFKRHNDDWESPRDQTLIVHQRIEATGRDSGAEIELRAWVVWWLEDGKVAELRSFAERAEAESAAASSRPG